MEMRKSDKRALQHILQKAGIYTGSIDGVLGNGSLNASNTYLAGHASRLPDGYTGWPNKRLFVAAYQIGLLEAGSEVGSVDGYFGPLTKDAGTWFIRGLDGVLVVDFENLAPEDVNPNNFPKETTSILNSVYGNVNPPNSCNVNIVKVTCPWKMGLDWNMSQPRGHFRVHRDVADSLKRILEAVFQHYGEAGIKKHGLNRFSGDYNCRKIRGGSRPSTHAWGIAIDFYGSRNELKRSTNDSVPPTLAHPELKFFWERWEAEGWYSLGRMEDRDWMHIQAAKGKRSKFYHQ